MRKNYLFPNKKTYINLFCRTSFRKTTVLNKFFDPLIGYFFKKKKEKRYMQTCFCSDYSIYL